jgi:hypothetical protein
MYIVHLDGHVTDLPCRKGSPTYQTQERTCGLVQCPSVNAGVGKSPIDCCGGRRGRSLEYYVRYGNTVCASASLHIILPFAVSRVLSALVHGVSKYPLDAHFQARSSQTPSAGLFSRSRTSPLLRLPRDIATVLEAYCEVHEDRIACRAGRRRLLDRLVSGYSVQCCRNASHHGRVHRKYSARQAGRYLPYPILTSLRCSFALWVSFSVPYQRRLHRQAPFIGFSILASTGGPPMLTQA